MPIPDPNPEGLFTDVNYQLFETYFPGDAKPPVPLSIGGFVRNYYNQTIAIGRNSLFSLGEEERHEELQLASRN